jgi:hypothetical protein
MYHDLLPLDPSFPRIKLSTQSLFSIVHQYLHRKSPICGLEASSTEQNPFTHSFYCNNPLFQHRTTAIMSSNNTGAIVSLLPELLIMIFVRLFPPTHFHEGYERLNLATSLRAIETAKASWPSCEPHKSASAGIA